MLGLLEKKNIFVGETAGMGKGWEAIGQTREPDAVPVPGFGDFDLFVLCSRIPSREERIQPL